MNKNKPAINEEDVKLMMKIAKYGFVDYTYVLKFYKTACAERTVRKRIDQLALHNYLTITETFIPPEYTSSNMKTYMIVSLGKSGKDLVQFYTKDPEQISMQEIAPYRMYHQCQVAMVCDSIEEAYNSKEDGLFEVIDILNEREAFIEGTFNMPDAVIIFSYKDKSISKNNIAVFIELERSYTSTKRLDNKLKRYMHSFNTDVYKTEYSLILSGFRTLFIAQTNGQYERLYRKISEANESKQIEVLVNRYADVCNNPLEKFYAVPNVEDNISLLGKYPL